MGALKYSLFLEMPKLCDQPVHSWRPSVTPSWLIETLGHFHSPSLDDHRSCRCISSWTLVLTLSSSWKMFGSEYSESESLGSLLFQQIELLKNITSHICWCGWLSIIYRWLVWRNLWMHISLSRPYHNNLVEDDCGTNVLICS